MQVSDPLFFERLVSDPLSGHHKTFNFNCRQSTIIIGHLSCDPLPCNRASTYLFNCRIPLLFNSDADVFAFFVSCLFLASTLCLLLFLSMKAVHLMGWAT